MVTLTKGGRLWPRAKPYDDPGARHMVRRRQIEKRTDRLRQLDGDNAKSVAAQCNIRMHWC